MLMPTREDILFGACALRRHWLNQRDLHKAIRRLEREEKEGRRRTLGETLMEQGRLTPKREGEMLLELGLEALFCAQCGSQQYGPIGGAGKVECAVCGEKMSQVETFPFASAKALSADENPEPADGDSADPPSTRVDTEGVPVRPGAGDEPSTGDRGFVYSEAALESGGHAGRALWWVVAAALVALAVGGALGYWLAARGE